MCPHPVPGAVVPGAGAGVGVGAGAKPGKVPGQCVVRGRGGGTGEGRAGRGGERCPLCNRPTGKERSGSSGQGSQPGPMHGNLAEMPEKGPGLPSRPFFQILDQKGTSEARSVAGTQAPDGRRVGDRQGGKARGRPGRAGLSPGHADPPIWCLLPCTQALEEVTSG